MRNNSLLTMSYVQHGIVEKALKACTQITKNTEGPHYFCPYGTDEQEK